MKKVLITFIILTSKVLFAEGYDVISLGYFDIKLDGSSTNEAIDYRFERRFDKSLLRIGPEEFDFFDIKPFAGFEGTSDSAVYVLGGIYLDDNAGTLFTGDSSNFLFTPSFGAGIYDDGDGKKLGNNIQFRTTIEFSYQLENKQRIGLSLGHISNFAMKAMGNQHFL